MKQKTYTVREAQIEAEKRGFIRSRSWFNVMVWHKKIATTQQTDGKKNHLISEKELKRIIKEKPKMKVILV